MTALNLIFLQYFVCITVITISDTTYHVLHVGSLWPNVGSERVVDVQNGLLVVIRFVCVGAANEENEQDFSQHFSLEMFLVINVLKDLKIKTRQKVLVASTFIGKKEVAGVIS